jgi:glyoxylase-like metal-dependent hydrolase (beta-lactamase superfamily II)
MSVEIEAFFDADTNTITYLASEPNSKKAALIDSVLDFDPASGRVETHSAEALADHIEKSGLEVVYILETHLHADHLTAAQYLKERLGGQIGIGEKISTVQKAFGAAINAGSEFKIDGSQFDILLAEGDRLPLGDDVIKVMHTPGHTPTCVTYLVDGAAFVGDTIFMPDMGSARCNFPAGSARTLFHSIGRILTLPPETRIFVGHDYGPGGREIAWETTVGEQLQDNIHFKTGSSEEDFVEMRQARDATLGMPRLLLPAVQVNMRAGAFPPSEDNGVCYLKLPVNQF